MPKTITQLPVAATVTPNAVLAADNAAGTATEKVTIGQIIALAPVQSVANKTGAVAITAADVGLGNVNNTADADKPISNATQTALNGKAALNHSHDATAISGLAPIATSGSAADLAVGTVPPARLPVATAGTLGGVRQGANVTIDGTGTLSSINSAAYAVSQQAPAASQNDFNPGSAPVVRLVPSTALNITGLVAGTDGQMRVLYNAGSNNVSLMHNSPSSTSGNRFFLYNSAVSYVLLPNCGVTLVYDATSQFWRVF